MTRYFIYPVLVLVGAFGIQAQPPEFGDQTFVLDFTKNHTEEDLKGAGLEYKKALGDSSYEVLLFQNQKINVEIPGGRRFEQKVVMGSISIRDGRLQEFETYGVIMPQDEAYEVAKMLHISLGLPLDELDQWYEKNKGKARDTNPYDISNSNIFPVVSIGIHTSMNELYPWTVALKLSWNLRIHKDWDEQRAAQENQPPPAGYETVSLEPPSGNIYDGRDAYKHLREEQEKFEKAQKEKEASNLSSRPRVKTSKAKIKTPPTSVARQSKQNSPSVWIVIGLFIIVGVGAIILKRKLKF